MITFKLIVDVCQNIRENVQSVDAYRPIRIGSQNLKALGSRSDWISPCWIRIGFGSFNMWIRPPLGRSDNVRKHNYHSYNLHKRNFEVMQNLNMTFNKVDFILLSH